MRTVFTNSLFSVEIKRSEMKRIIDRCWDGGIINRVTLNEELQNAVLQDNAPDMMDREFESVEEAINSANHTGSIVYYPWEVPFFKVSARVIEDWIRTSDDDEDTYYGVSDISNFTYSEIDKIIDNFLFAE